MPGSASYDEKLPASPRGRRLAIVALIAVLAATVSVIAVQRPSSAPAAEPAPVAITEAPPLRWAFKATWVNYAEEPQLTRGASLVPTPGKAAVYSIDWPLASGSYDESTHTTTIAYGGTAHWQKYPAAEYGYTPPPGEPDAYLLDVTVSDPEITISSSETVLSAEVTSREFNGNRTLKLIDYGRVPLENLEALGVTPTVEAGTTTWSDIPTTLTEEGSPAFAGFYLPGTTLDAISFSYAGPGGAPDFSEHFDREGMPKLKLDRNVLYHESAEPEPDKALWIDEDDLIANAARTVEVGGVLGLELQAFDLEQMKPVGEPLTLLGEAAPFGEYVVADDTSDDRVLYHGENEQGITRWVKFNPAAGRYENGTIADPRMDDPEFLGGSGLGWNEQLDLGYRMQWVEATDEWQLVTYKEGQNGLWTRKAYPVPGLVGDGQTVGPARTFEPFAAYARNYATVSDGSMVVLDNDQFIGEEPAPGAASTIPAAFRLTLDEAAGSVDVEALPVEVPNEGGGFQAVQTAPGGEVSLIHTYTPDGFVQCGIGADGTIRCDPPADLEGNVEPPAYAVESFATDPASGMTWFAGLRTQQIAAFRGGDFLGSEILSVRNPRGGPILVGPDHTVYVQSNDGSPRELGGSRTWGWAKLDLLGYTPTVTDEPDSQAVSLGTGEDSRSVSFTAAATGGPGLKLQWQEKAPGAPRYSDLAGQTAETLTVNAEPGMDGTEYRAVFENAAGRVASAAATLSVDYAPRITLDLANVSAVEGEPAEFAVLAEGNPAPQITWERRVGGFWQPISPSDDNFRIAGPALTVLETNTDQSGSLFRAKLVNSAGTASSRTARLTVTAAASIPPEGIAVSSATLDWLGNEVMQKAPPFGGSNYFSAGASAGNEATYRSVDGDAAVLQVAADGTEAPATYATRAAHVTDGGRQVVRLYGGHGRVEGDGSADIRWDAAFSVNFYGGLVPFTISDPELRIAADGSGELTATLSGCSASRSEPNVCTPLTPASDVVVADFSAARIEPGKPLTVQPAYSHVEVDVPTGSGGVPQQRSGPSWGSWPQSFVDFQLQTGLDSYWYSSGSGDADKPPLPFTVNLEGAAGPTSEPPAEAKPTVPAAPSGSGGSVSAGKGTSTAPAKKPKGTRGLPAKVRFRKAVRMDGQGPATVATVVCPKGGAGCVAIVPARLATRIDGRRYLVAVHSPRRISAGRSAAVTLALSKAARSALGDRHLTLRLRIVVRSGGHTTTRIVRVRVAGTAAR